MKTLIWPVTLIFFLSSFQLVSGQEEWTLQMCIDYALENNIRIKQQKLNAEYYENLVSKAKSDRLPALNGNIYNNYNYGRSLTYENTYKNVNSVEVSGYLNTGITLWNGSTINNSIKQQKINLEAALQELEKTKDNIILNIAAAYLEILFSGELVNISESQIQVTKQQIDRTEKLVEAGNLAQGALLEIEAQLAREELELVNDSNQLKLAYLKLYQLLEIPAEKNFKIIQPLLPEIRANNSMTNSYDIYKDAIQIRPEIRAAQLRMESAIRSLDISRGQRFPKLTFGANYFNLYNNKYTDIYNNPFNLNEQLSNNQRIEMGFNLNIPIFNNSQIKTEIANASLKIDEYKYQLLTTRNIMRKEIEQAYTNALAALNRYRAGEKAVKYTEEAFRYTEEKYNVGLINSFEYNQSKNYLTVARSELLQAKYEYIFRTKILDFYRGVPIEL